jgi:hypothetical protein
MIERESICSSRQKMRGKDNRVPKADKIEIEYREIVCWNQKEMANQGCVRDLNKLNSNDGLSLRSNKFFALVKLAQKILLFLKEVRYSETRL